VKPSPEPGARAYASFRLSKIVCWISVGTSRDLWQSSSARATWLVTQNAARAGRTYAPRHLRTYERTPQRTDGPILVQDHPIRNLFPRYDAGRLVPPGGFRNVVAVQQHATLVGLHPVEHEPDNGSFARAISPDQTDRCSGLDRQVGNRSFKVAIRFAKVFGLEEHGIDTADRIIKGNQSGA